MVKSPPEIAAELFEDNQNASVFEITQQIRSEVRAGDAEFVTAVVRAYWKLNSDHLVGDYWADDQRLSGVASKIATPVM